MTPALAEPHPPCLARRSLLSTPTCLHNINITFLSFLPPPPSLSRSLPALRPRSGWRGRPQAAPPPPASCARPATRAARS
eukprot:1567495-Rhodomonas_salina.2